MFESNYFLIWNAATLIFFRRENSLIDREADLLNRGRSEKTMKNLRKRTSNMFHMFVMTPEFNPEAARFQKVPDAALLEAQ